MFEVLTDLRNKHAAASRFRPSCVDWHTITVKILPCEESVNAVVVYIIKQLYSILTLVVYIRTTDSDSAPRPL